MNCNQYQELLSPYLDGVLSETQCRDLENHLRHCTFCQGELEALRQTVNLLQAWSQEELELPDGFEERLRLRLKQASQPWYRRLPKSWLSLSAAAAILLVVAFSAYGNYNNYNNILKLSSRQQLKPASPSSSQAAPPETAAPEAALPPSGNTTLMLMEDAIQEPPQEIPSTERASVSAAKVPVQAEQGEVPAQAGQPVTNGRGRNASPNGTLSSRREGESTKIEGQETGDSQETPVSEPEKIDQGSGQELEDQQSTPGDDQLNHKSVEEKEYVSTASAATVPEEDNLQPEILLGKDKVPPEAAGWAEKNKKVAGVFKKNFDSWDAYLIAMGEKTTEGYGVRFQKAGFDGQKILTLDIGFIEPDPDRPAIAVKTYPYEVFAVPGGTVVKIRAVNKDGMQELLIEEAPPA